MKIIENTPGRLELRSDPYLQIIFGLIFAVVGIVITFFFGRSIDIHCQKAVSNTLDCQINQKLLGFQAIGRQRVADVQRAYVAESRDSHGNATYRVYLATDSGDVAVMPFASSGYSAKSRLADQINSLTQDASGAALDTTLPMDWWILIFLAAFTGGGIVTTLVAKRTGIEMVRAEGVMRIRKHGLFGSGEEEHLLAEVEGAALESSRTSRGGTTYRIAINLVGGGALLLTRWYSSGWKDKQRAVEAMNQFLAARPR